MIECKNCGRFISPDNGYCDYCGQKISDEDIQAYQQKKLKETSDQENKQKDIKRYDSLLDTKSKKIIEFFKAFNILLAVINALGALVIFFVTVNFMSLPARITIFIMGLGYASLLFMMIEMLTKHFSNVAQIKEINYQLFIKNKNEVSNG